MIQHCSTDQIPRKIHAYVLLGLFASFDREMQVSIYIYISDISDTDGMGTRYRQEVC